MKLLLRSQEVPEENVNIVRILHLGKEAGKRCTKVERQGLIISPIKVSEGIKSIV